MSKFKKIISLFFIFFKIGLFTFGGGLAMIPFIEKEIIDKKNWITKDEFLDMVAISESSPGPIAINMATFVGYKTCGFFGSVFSTLGVIVPSFFIIFVISLFFDKFLELTFVSYAFMGIKACVVFLILTAGISFLKVLPKNFFNYFLFILSFITIICFTLFSVNFSSIWLILIGGVLGLSIYLIPYIKQKIKNKESKND